MSSEQHAIQRNVMRNVAVVTSIMVAVGTAGYAWLPSKWLPIMTSPAEQIVFTIRCNVPTVGFFLILISHIGNTRFTSAQANPLEEKDKDKVEVHVRVLQNTLEQFVISFVLQLATATWINSSQMMIIPIIAMLFVVGRVLFWIGYLDPSFGRTNRSYGLPLTQFPSVFMFIFCLYKLVYSLLWLDVFWIS